MIYKDFDTRDTCLQVNHYYWASMVLGINKRSSAKFFWNMYFDCRLKGIFGHRKNPDYKWSNSDGLTKFLYDKILKYFKVDPYKGLNSDQYRSYALVNYTVFGHTVRVNKRLFWGFLCRLGFTPSLMENILFKPQAYILFFKKSKYRKFNPLYWLAHILFYISANRELRKPIEESTTNKITLIPTMYYLGYKLPNKEYTDEVYRTYYRYPNQKDLRETMQKAVNYLRDRQ